MDKITWLLTLALALAFTSCHKPGSADQGVTLDSTYLKQLVYLSDPDPAGKVDTLGIIDYTYDDLKRPSMQHINIAVDIRNIDMDLAQSVTYRYKGDEAQPYLLLVSTRYQVDNGYDWDDSVFLEYKNGWIARDSSIGNSPHIDRHGYESKVTVFHVDGDSIRILRTARSVRNGEVIFESKDTNAAFVRTTDNNMEQMRPGEGLDLWNVDNVFNTSPDPANRFYPPWLLQFHYWPGEFVAYSKLKTHAARASAPPPLPGNTYFIDYTYTFRNDGYPLTAGVTDDRNKHLKHAYVYY